MIFIVTAYGGFYMAGRLKNRRDFLCAMSDALAFTATEIEFSRCELARIFRRISDIPALCGFFEKCAGEIENFGIQTAWKHSVNECAEKAGIKSDEKQTLLQVGTQIGKSDIEGQKKTIKRAIVQLDIWAKAAGEEYERLAKPYRSCGILLGVFVLIIIA